METLVGGGWWRHLYPPTRPIGQFTRLVGIDLSFGICPSPLSPNPRVNLGNGAKKATGSPPVGEDSLQ